MQRLVSVIIINYNNNNFTLECLESLKNQSYKNFEIILVDNASKLEIFMKLKEELNQLQKILNITLIRSEKNLYFGAGNNKGIRMANGEYICLLNNDTEVQPDFIEMMVDFLEKNPKAGMISPKIKLLPDKEYIWTTGGQVDFRTSAVVTNRGYLTYDPEDVEYNQIGSVDFAPGTALFVKKRYLEEIGLIDEIYFMYWEDPDWNFRAKEIGYESFYVPTTIVYHKIPINRKINDRRQIFNDFFFKRNKQIFVLKFGTIKDIFIFYRKFIYALFLEFHKKLVNKQIRLLVLNLIAIWKGFRIGLMRRLNRTCKKYLLKDFHFVKKLQNYKFGL